MDTVLVTVRPLESYQQTVRTCFDLARRYMHDLLPYRFQNFYQAYNYVRALQYREDPRGQETTSRPLHTLKKDWQGPRDCDDKTTILISAAHLFSLPVRAIVCGQSSAPHHIYPEIEIRGLWTAADATYPDLKHDCRLGKKLYNERFREVFYE